ncbi:hypothetical protein SESBI_47644 [Sesbania bispinosa]|nr:hypothetical protein SESBI_47644 [Sesbania bispinosa]
MVVATVGSRRCGRTEGDDGDEGAVHGGLRMGLCDGDARPAVRDGDGGCSDSRAVAQLRRFRAGKEETTLRTAARPLVVVASTAAATERGGGRWIHAANRDGGG